MKRIGEYTEDELITLEDKEINDIIDYECALTGVSLLPESPTMPIKSEVVPDITAYEVGDFTFMEQEDALKLVEYIKNATLYTTDMALC